MFRCCFFLSLFLVAIFYAVFLVSSKNPEIPWSFPMRWIAPWRFTPHPSPSPPPKKGIKQSNLWQFTSAVFYLEILPFEDVRRSGQTPWLGGDILANAPFAVCRGQQVGDGAEGPGDLVVMVDVWWFFCWTWDGYLMPLLLLYFTWHIRWLGKIIMFEIKVLLELGSQFGVYNNDLFSELFV